MEPCIEAVLCFLVRGDHICLARKKRKIGVGYWNGYGGKIEAEQTPEQAVVNEVRQECGVGVDPSSIVWMGEIEFVNHAKDSAVSHFVVYVCFASRFTGEPNRSVEMGPPFWAHRNALPYGEMMPADRFWLPRMLRGEFVRGCAVYGPDQRELLEPMKFE